jgi:hypothetical protein
MARMSIDDSVLRDPRIDELAEAMGWSRRETVGALIDLWAVCYDQVSATLPAKHVDRVGGAPGFSAQMVAAGLAKVLREDETLLRISGVEGRIEYLTSKRDAGRQGGVKSGQSRRSKIEARASSASKQTFEAAEAPANPIPSASAVPNPPVVVPETKPATPEPDRSETRRQAISLIWQEHLDLRRVVAAELGQRVTDLHPTDGGRSELRERFADAEMVHSTIDETVERCRHVLAVVAAECREKRTIRWFDGQIWRRDRFDRSAAQPLKQALQPFQVIDLSADDNPFASGAIEPMFTVDPE